MMSNMDEKEKKALMMIGAVAVGALALLGGTKGGRRRASRGFRYARSGFGRAYGRARKFRFRRRR